MRRRIGVRGGRWSLTVTGSSATFHPARSVRRINSVSKMSAPNRHAATSGTRGWRRRSLTPWVSLTSSPKPWRNTPETPCGDAGVLGHRHDQTALSVIAWQQGLKLTNPPEIFAYKGCETAETILIADGAY